MAATTTSRTRWLAAWPLVMLAGCVVAPAHHYPSPPPVPVPPPAPRVVTPPAPEPANGPMYFYPEWGQDEARQDRDRYECYRWAVRETGVDPGMTPVRQGALPPPEPPAPPVRRDGAPVVAGAATGAVIGAVTSGPRHAASNAVLGAIFGAAIGAIAQEQNAQAAERAQARRESREDVRRLLEAERAQRPLDNFRRAMSACMGGRGYRVG